MHRFLLLAVVIGSSLAASPARATVLLQLELTDLVGRADQVFLGQAVASTSRWTAAGKQIVTDTIFEVRQSLRGARGGKITVRTLGGVVDGIGQRVAGSPMFAKGDEVLLFTERRGSKVQFVVGMAQGAYRVRRDLPGRPSVRLNLQGVSLARRSPSGQLSLKHGVHSKRGERQPLETLLRRVQQVISSCDSRQDRCRR